MARVDSHLDGWNTDCSYLHLGCNDLQERREKLYVEVPEIYLEYLVSRSINILEAYEIYSKSPGLTNNLIRNVVNPETDAYLCRMKKSCKRRCRCALFRAFFTDIC